MKFYDLDEIRKVGNCIQFATTVLGLEINHEGRCQATWRGGDGFNVSIKDHEWYDHVAKVGGGIVELCAIAKCGDIKDFQASQEILGDWLNFTPVMVRGEQPMVSARHSELLADGYAEVKRYGYVDLEGNLIHFVARFEHPEKPKQFMQGSPSGWGLRGITPILYRMADWVDKTVVAIVEGEKDVDTLIDQLEFPATTNCGGADKWRPEYAELFRDKNVIVVRDNDEAGEKHALRVSRELKDVAKRIVVICPSSQPKGDVTDWVEQEGGTLEKLKDLARGAEEVKLEELEVIDVSVEEAKQANKYSLRNFIPEKQVVGNQTKVVKVARTLNSIVKEVHKRFLGFPCRVGNSEVLFDHDRDTGNVIRIRKPAQLFAWMGRKSKKTVDWAKGDDLPTKEELMCALMEEARVYEGVSQVPEWPKRDDIYYAHATFPEASKDLKYLKGLCAFWEPASRADAVLIMAFFCAGLWYRPETRKPLWLADADARGAGKSMLVTSAALLFYGEVLDIDKTHLTHKPEEIMKNLLSTEGRDARYVLFDNADGLIKSPILAKLVTQRSITGRPAFGAGMEVRPNNLNYCITSNSATLDDDLAIRAMIINLLKPKNYNPHWDTDREAYIIKHQRHIIADILSVLESENQFEAPTHTRFSKFEKDVLQKVCDSVEEYEMVMGAIMASRERANLDNETASLLEDIIRERLLQVEGIAPGQDNVFIHTQVFSKWLKWANESEFDSDVKVAKHDVRNFAKNRHTKFIKDLPDRIWTNGRDPGSKQIRGFYWEANPNSTDRKIVMPGYGESKIPRVM